MSGGKKNSDTKTSDTKIGDTHDAGAHGAGDWRVGARRWDRRLVLKSAAAAGLAHPAVWMDRALAADQLTVADSGGTTGQAMRLAFYDPFEKETGVKVVNVAHDSDPTAQLRVLVDTKNPVWDVCLASLTNIASFPSPDAYFEPLLIKPEEAQDLIPNVLRPYWMGMSVYAIVMAYRTDKYGNKGPRNWTDFWNVEQFPGRRGLFRDVDGVLEQALMADGVPSHELYPLDDEKVERAFKALERIKPHINVWWTTGAQCTQILQNGEVDMSGTWAGRAYAAVEAGAPVELVWSQGTYGVDGLGIVKGSPKLELARKFVRFCIDPKRQAVYSSNIINGPTNTKAYDYISAERAKVLPTSPANLKGLQLNDGVFWGKNKARLSARYLAWILK